MIFVLGDKKYDTETATEVVSYQKSYPAGELWGHTYYSRRLTRLYKTQKGNWFSVAEKDNGQKVAFSETEESAKTILKQLSEVDLYAEHFGQLEEA